LKPVDHPDLRPLILHENWPRHIYPMRKDFDVHTPVPMLSNQVEMMGVEGEGVFQTMVGPIHAGIIEPGHFRFSHAGESILRLDARLGYVSRGIEKAVEGRPIEKAFYQVERISAVCTVAHSLAYCHAIEQMAGVTVPQRAQYLRALVAELERLWNHVGNIGNMCAGMGFAVGVMAGARLREMCMRMNDALTGHRMLRGMVVPGGVRQNITPALATGIRTMLDKLLPDFEEMIALFDNDEFANRVVTMASCLASGRSTWASSGWALAPPAWTSTSAGTSRTRRTPPCGLRCRSTPAAMRMPACGSGLTRSGRRSR
jgi:NADH:ubiquinone oxidoreductase subunit D